MEETNTKERILGKSDELFMRYGIRSVTMDDIASELGISKKTLYEYVDNKSKLIEEIFHKRTNEEKACMAEIKDTCRDAVDEILRIARYVINMLRELSPTTVYDLKKYYRKTWNHIESVHQAHIQDLISSNLQRGMNEGLYRSDLDPDIITKLYIGTSFLVADDELFPVDQYRMSELFQEFIHYHIRGIASPGGLTLLEKYLFEEQEETP